MSAPKRIQRRRTKGWRLPEGAVYVGRATKWGNPWSVGQPRCGCRSAGECTHAAFLVPDGQEAVETYRWWIRQGAYLRQFLHELRGRDLACWCRLCDRHADGKPLGELCADCAPCHADVLLELANGPAGEERAA